MLAKRALPPFNLVSKPGLPRRREMLKSVSLLASRFEDVTPDSFLSPRLEVGILLYLA